MTQAGTRGGDGRGAGSLARVSATVASGGAEMSNEPRMGGNAVSHFECGTPDGALSARVVYYANLKRPFAA